MYAINNNRYIHVGEEKIVFKWPTSRLANIRSRTFEQSWALVTYVVAVWDSKKIHVAVFSIIRSCFFLVCCIDTCIVQCHAEQFYVLLY